ncbi:hypothetical protein FA15DRAFT_679546 [Coprinopsis marcescibilis]|uniref:Uncharacterized protein n=1 Tax=Coprinopsis marcescibilis TaxID=230819 RepID=A0A5C3L0I4_COPMA|nr:hypothetical protein FA15DRAFT_679546 [Coprinopsis marcescibilis]
MCSLKTEGTKHGCGHYIITRKVEQRDCNSPYCIHSRLHAQPNCPHCPHCRRFLEPDHEEIITQQTNIFCKSCEYWFNEGRVRQQAQASAQRR